MNQVLHLASMSAPAVKVRASGEVNVVAQPRFVVFAVVYHWTLPNTEWTARRSLTRLDFLCQGF
jgi:hypothetical protein